jgi:transcriptional/translational regulatory protein YebC/TACO1
LQVPSDKAEAFEEAVIEAGAEDYRLDEGFAVVYTSNSDLHVVKDSLEKAGFTADSTKIERVASMPIELSDEDLERVSKLLDLLDENDDVTNVYTNIAE